MKWLIVVIFIILAQGAHAALIRGSVYDSSLKAVDAQVIINTTPEQFKVARQGEYSFEVPNGFYRLIASQIEQGMTISSESRNISIKGQGSYIIDFVLFPSFEEEDEISELPDFNFPQTQDENSPLFIFISVSIILLLVSFGIFYYWKKQKKKVIKNEKTENNDINGLLEIIRQEGGRTTQKEIRKRIPLSEAKISLMIAELEHKGKIEKIKKGRGNIIVLK